MLRFSIDPSKMDRLLVTVVTLQFIQKKNLAGCNCSHFHMKHVKVTSLWMNWMIIGLIWKLKCSSLIWSRLEFCLVRFTVDHLWKCWWQSAWFYHLVWLGGPAKVLPSVSSVHRTRPSFCSSSAPVICHTVHYSAFSFYLNENMINSV